MPLTRPCRESIKTLTRASSTSPSQNRSWNPNPRVWTRTGAVHSRSGRGSAAAEETPDPAEHHPNEEKPEVQRRSGGPVTSRPATNPRMRTRIAGCQPLGSAGRSRPAWIATGCRSGPPGPPGCRAGARVDAGQVGGVQVADAGPPGDARVGDQAVDGTVARGDLVGQCDPARSVGDVQAAVGHAVQRFGRLVGDVHRPDLGAFPSRQAGLGRALSPTAPVTTTTFPARRPVRFIRFTVTESGFRQASDSRDRPGGCAAVCGRAGSGQGRSRGRRGWRRCRCPGR